ncbi:MAG TPA: tetraacyldisaccharide 4'-kinase [Beijerinckiaceae bacterium]
MRLEAPAFWQEPRPGLAARALQPLGALYGLLAARRMARRGARAALPVICVGNFTLGGTGKTPTALAIATRLEAFGERPAFLTRGYGGSLPGPVRVDPERHGSREVGDEPLLLARAAPTVVARDRVAGAALCARKGATVIVMDDGLQNPSLAKDLALAVVDAGVGLGNGLTFPAGPLRAPAAAQWPRVHGLILVGAGEAGAAVARAAEERGLPVLRGSLLPDPAVAEGMKGRRLLAFAGIGRPDKFFATLAELGAEVVLHRPFPDHHAYAAAEIEALVAEAARAGLSLVTTEKDLVRLRGDAATAGASGAIEALPVALALAEPAALDALLAESLSRARASP